MKDIYNKLVFIIHKKCNAECSMCCFKSNPSCHEKLNIERVKEYLDQSENIKDITSVSFTGGEPFLEYRTLLDLIKYATIRGKKASTITNGYWATTYDKAYKRLLELKNSGLTHLNISHDNYHSQYVKTEYVKHVLDAAMQLNIPTTLVMVTTKGEHLGHIVDQLGNGLYGTSLSVSPCLPAGAAANYPDDKFDKLLKIEGLQCVYGRNIVVGYDGTIFPCCSQVIYDNFGLQLGNFENINLADVLKKTENNALLYLLRNEKIDFFADIAKNKLDITLPEKVVNVCELCSLLFKKENISLYKPYIIEKIKEIKKEPVYDR